MFSFFKRSNTKVPNWASFFKPDEYDRFLKAIDHYFVSRQISYQMEDGTLNCDAGIFDYEKLGLVNLAQLCKQNKPREYQAIVADHFEVLRKAQRFEIEFDQIIHNFEKVKSYLGVRLYPDHFTDVVDKSALIGANFAGNVDIILIFDFPDTIKTVEAKWAESWGVDIDTLFETAIQNIKNKYPLEISRQDLGKFKIWFVQGEHFYAPNIVFYLNEYPEMIGPYGSIIGIPHRHSVVVYPITGKEIAEALVPLVNLINGLYKDGPGSISNYLFWYKGGGFECQTYTIEQKKIKLVPTESFLAMLDSLK
jgi:hypothetical protein